MTSEEQLVQENFNSMLVSILAHDLRQPFAAFLMAADVFKYTKKNLSQAEMHILFEDIRTIAANSIALLDGLLYWMKSKNSEAGYESSSLLLQELMHEANSLQLHEQLSKNITFLNLIPVDQTVQAHKQMLQFINRNILSNATKHSPAGGAIGVTCSVENGYITVAFTDQGKGVKEGHLEKLFSIQENFNEGNSYITGVGIALSICRDMITKMNGKIWAESVPEIGTTFYYSLPLPG